MIGYIIFLAVGLSSIEMVPNIIALPKIPNSFLQKYGGIGKNNLCGIWEHRLTKKSGVEPLPEPKTIFIVDSVRMSNLSPQDVGNPLYSDDYGDLADTFVLDNVAFAMIDLDDPQLISSEGLTLQSISNKDLTLVKDPDTGSISVNKIQVKKTEKLDDGTFVLTLANLLFNHTQDVRAAARELAKNSRHNVA